MPYVSPEQLARAREVDLLTYLQRNEPDELVHFTGSTYTTRTHDSLKISNGKWCWWSRGVGGSTVLDYLIEVRGLSLPEAVSAITSTVITQHSREGPMQYTAPRVSQQTTPFQLPPRHANNRRAFSYLQSRGIDPEIFNRCIKHGQIYEDAAHHNCVFVGFEGDTPKYAALRSTLSKSVFAGEAPGSDKHFSFAVPKRRGDYSDNRNSAHRNLVVFKGGVKTENEITKQIPRATPRNGIKTHAIRSYWQTVWKIFAFSSRVQPKSDCQTRSVSQNQICQCKQHIQFCGLLLQASVSCLSVSKQTLYNAKNVLYFCSDGRLLMLSAL